MSQKRKKQFDERRQKIIKVAEQLLLDSAVYDLTLDNLAEHLELAKGTLYKHFTSKDELLLSVLIEYEKEALQPTLITDGASASVVRVMLFFLNFPQRTVMMTSLEEQLSATVVGLNRLFDELYAVRHEGAENLLDIATQYLHDQNSNLDPVEYLSTVFAMTLGGATLLSSSFYQRFVGERESLKWLLIRQALVLPQLHRNDEMSHADEVVLPDTDPNAPPKLIKPLVPPVV